MIEKLKVKSQDEVINELQQSELGRTFTSLFSGVIEETLPTDREIFEKINEIIEWINNKE